MLHRTQTTLASLRIGDSFVYPKGNVAWRVTAKADKNKRVAVNQFNGSKQINKYDILKKQDTKIIFLQHTVAVPGEQIFLENLNEGDVFKMNTADVHEYVVDSKGHDFYNCRRTDEAAPIKGGRLATVIFVRHKAEA